MKDTPASLLEKHVDTGAPPPWRVQRDPASSDGAAGAWLLHDQQLHLDSGQQFFHQRIFLSGGGTHCPVFAVITPGREMFILHHLRIQLDEDNIQTGVRNHLALSAESDGSLSVSLDKDHGSGQLVDIAFSIVPRTVPPKSVTIPLEWPDPRAHTFLTVIVPPHRKAKARFHGPKTEPRVTRPCDGSRVLTWHLKNTPAVDHNPRSVSISLNAPNSEFAKAQPQPNAEFRRRRRSSETGYPTGNQRRKRSKLVPFLAVIALGAAAAASFHFLTNKQKPPADPPVVAEKEKEPAPPDLEPYPEEELGLPVVTTEAQSDDLDAVMEMIGAGNFEEAEKACRQILETNPENTNAAIALAGILRQAGQTSGAISMLERFIEANPESPSAWQTLAELFYESKQVPNAIWAAEEARELDSENPEILQTLAGIYFKAERFEEAEVTYGRASLILPDSFRIWEGLGLSCMGVRKYPDAVAALQRAIAIDPDRPQALNNLAAALMHTGENEEAEKYLQRCITIAPGYQLAWENLIEVFERTNRPDGKARAEAELAKLRAAVSGEEP